MPKSLYSTPEDFSLSPLLQLLPVKSRVSKLKGLNSSLFARYEKVHAQMKDPEQNSGDQKGLAAEAVMLRQVLEWLDITPEKQ
jgi:hypothetical protein